MKIYYCDHCQKRVPEEELEGGTALIEADDKAYCAACVVALDKHKPKRPATRGYALPSRAARATPSVLVHPHALPNAQPHAHASGERAPHPAQHAHAAEKSRIPHLALGAVAVVALVLVVYVWKLAGSSARPVAQPKLIQQPQPAPKIEAAPPVKGPQPVAAPPKETAQPSGLFSAMAQEHARESDPEKVQARAAALLSEAKDFWSKNPNDPWTYLDKLRAIPDRTPAGNEAAAAIVALNVPLEKSGTVGWYRDWKVENKSAAALVSMNADFDGKKNALKSLPPGKDDELRFNRSFTLPAGKSYLSFSARGSDKGDCAFVIEINGKLQAFETLKGKAWKQFQFDLSKLAGQNATVQIRHVATGWDSEECWWTEPLLSAKKTDSVAALEFNASAAAYSKNTAAIVARAAARPFVGTPDWPEPSDWKSAKNLLALADPNAGAIDGEWKRLDSGALHMTKPTAKSVASRLEIPFHAPAEYSIKATFERKSGNGDAALLLTHPSGTQFFWLIGATENKVVALGEVNGKRFDGNPASVNLGKVLDNKRRYTTTVDVRKDRISAYLDGKLVTEWTPDMGPIKTHDTWKLKDAANLGIGAWQSEVIFYSVEVLEKK